ERDVGRLRMDMAVDLGPLPMKAVLLVADVADGVPRHLDQYILGNRGGPARLAGKHDAVGCRHRLDAAARLRLRREIGIDDGIRDAVADLVGMAFRHRLAGKNKILLRQETYLPVNPLERRA